MTASESSRGPAAEAPADAFADTFADAFADAFDLRAIGPEGRAELVDLRRRAYRRSSSFAWFDEAALDWTADDDAAVVLGVYAHRTGHDAALLSTARVTFHPDRAAVEAFMGYSTQGIPARFPVAVCSRVATEASYGRHGLTAVTRHAIVRHARRLGLASISGVVYEDAPRVRSMAEQGYELHAPPSHWDGETVLRARPLVLSLPAARFDEALARIERQAAAALAACRCDDDALAHAFDRQATRALASRSTAGSSRLA